VRGRVVEGINIEQVNSVTVLVVDVVLVEAA